MRPAEFDMGITEMAIRDQAPLRSRRYQGAKQVECTLTYHVIGSRVRWQKWNSDRACFEWVTGTVTEHHGRVLMVSADPDGIVVRTSCGHVTAEPPLPANG
jgi:hypothetical protein